MAYENLTRSFGQFESTRIFKQIRLLGNLDRVGQVNRTNWWIPTEYLAHSYKLQANGFGAHLKLSTYLIKSNTRVLYAKM